MIGCWPTKTVTTTDGETYDVSKAKTGKNLNLKDNKSDTVTPSFADLPSIYEAGKKDSSLSLLTSGTFWSSSEDDAYNAYLVGFNGYTGIYINIRIRKREMG